MSDEPVDLTPYIVPGSARLTSRPLDPYRGITPRERVQYERERAIVDELSRPYLVERPRESGPAPLEPAEAIRRAIEAVNATPPEPSLLDRMLTEQLNRLAATFHPGGRFACPVTGCPWALNVDPPELVELPSPASPALPHRLQYVGAPREQVELHLALHVDAHATDGAPPPVDPPEPDPWNAP